MQLANQGVTSADLSGQPMLPPAAAGPPAAQNQPPAHSPENPGRVSTPADPEGFERIYEGSFLEGALITQLSGDFPGPVLAQVSVPFYSADRQRILIPRGTRAIGTAQAVTNRDQARLAVGFHRLIFPDGRWVSLKFEGLDQVGTTALKDKVNRHYLQMFAAGGAVGILSGLTLQGSNPTPEACRLSRRRRGGLRPGCNPNHAAVPESPADDHDPRRPSAEDLVYGRCPDPGNGQPTGGEAALLRGPAARGLE